MIGDGIFDVIQMAISIIFGKRRKTRREKMWEEILEDKKTDTSTLKDFVDPPEKDEE